MTSREAADRLDQLAATPPEELDPRHVADAKSLLAMIPTWAIDRAAIFGVHPSARVPTRVVFYWARSRYWGDPGNRVTTIETLGSRWFDVHTDLDGPGMWQRLPGFPGAKCLDIADPSSRELLERVLAHQLDGAMAGGRLVELRPGNVPSGLRRGAGSREVPVVKRGAMMEGRSGRETVVLEVNRGELGLINNALNEVTNGIHMSEVEFRARLGFSVEDARKLLRRVQGLLDS